MGESRAPSEITRRDGGAVSRSAAARSPLTRDDRRSLQFTLNDLGYRFPDYPLPPGETPDSYLRR